MKRGSPAEYQNFRTISEREPAPTTSTLAATQTTGIVISTLRRFLYVVETNNFDSSSRSASSASLFPLLNVNVSTA